MASTGATIAGSGTATTASGSGANWTNPGNITSDDNNDATVSNTGFGESGHLVATQFGFSVTNSTIDGIEVTVGAKYLTQTQAIYAKLRDATGALVGNLKNVSIDQATETTFTLGGSADKWGTSLTTTDISDSDFGVEIWVDGVQTYDIAIDWVKINVTYTQIVGTRSYIGFYYGGLGAGGAVANAAAFFRRFVLNRRG